METRKKELAALKKGLKYSTGAATAASSLLDCIGIFVRIPGFIKWAVVALVGLIAGCFGCCTAPAEAEEKERKATEAELEHKREATDRHRQVELMEEMLRDMAEVNGSLQYHQGQRKTASVADEKTQLSKAQFAFDKWAALTKELKDQQADVKVSTAGMFTLRDLQRPSAAVTPVLKAVNDDEHVLPSVVFFHQSAKPKAKIAAKRDLAYGLALH